MNKQDLLIKLMEMILLSEDVTHATVTKTDGDKSVKKGDPVIVRCRDAGVHFGYYVSHAGREVHLAKSRRMWQWWAAKQMTLSAVAEFGLNLKKDQRIQTELSSVHILLEACEIIPCSNECVESFDKVESYDEQ